MVYERRGHWSGLLLWVLCSDLTLMVGSQEEDLALKNHQSSEVLFQNRLRWKT